MTMPRKLHLLTTLTILICALLLAEGAVAMRSAMPSSLAGSASVVEDVEPAIWSPFYYVNVTGATLRPRASATTWSYPGAGCISAVSSNDVFNLHLPIPNGSRIDYLRIYYYDTSASNSTAWVTSYDAAGGFDDVATVTSAGTAGYGTSLSAYVGHVVDTVNNGYVLNWQPNQTGATMQLCGLRVAYRIALDELVYMPLVAR